MPSPFVRRAQTPPKTHYVSTMGRRGGDRWSGQGRQGECGRGWSVGRLVGMQGSKEREDILGEF